MSNYPNQQKGGATQSDKLGNPIQHGSTGTNAAGGYNAGGTEFGNTKPTGGHGTKAAGHGQTDQLRRSGSGSSSSSEDDGQGGRRKKGLKDKIKEKLPGGHKEEQHQQGQYPSSGATTIPVGGVGYDQSGQQLHEKKGMVDKIKDKLPGAGTH